MAEKSRVGKPEDGNRRGFLKSAAVATAVAATGGSAAAQQAPPAKGRAPLNTPIKNLGFSPAELAMLTPAASQLTKAQMLQLQEWAATGDTKDAPLHLTIADLTSLQKAYNAMETRTHSGQGLTSSEVACCCCTPCCSCCAAAETA